MHPSFSTLINDATQLVRGGNLQAATAAIQRALRGNAPPAAASVNEDGDVIDIEAGKSRALRSLAKYPPAQPRHQARTASSPAGMPGAAASATTSCTFPLAARANACRWS